MNAEKYYEILSNRRKYLEIYGPSDVSEEDQDSYEKILPYYLSIDELTIDKIENEIANSADDLSVALLNEFLYVKKYRILTKKYSQLFLPLKIKRKNQQQEDINKIRDNEDIVDLLESGKELYKSPVKLLYIGVSFALLLDRLNRENESIEIINEIKNWYPENEGICKSLEKLIQNIYFRNKMHKQYKQSLMIEQDKTLTYLYKNIKFYQFNTDLFIGVNLFVFLTFLGLWITFASFFVSLMVGILLFNIINIGISIKKENLLMIHAFASQIFFYIAILVLYIIIYAIVK